jgi:hypothetical protein
MAETAATSGAARASSTRSAWLAPLFAGFAAFALRLTFIDDMEFKADEKWIAHFLPTVFHRPFNPLAEISAHSGVAHSNFVYYFMRLVSFGTDDPLRVAACIAGFNASAIALALWLSRRSRAGTLAFALSASSVALCLHSRKIWQPDLVAGWDVLALGLLAASGAEAANEKLAAGLAAAAGFALMAAGHMYLPGAAVAATVGPITLAVLLFVRKERPRALGWFLGLLAGAFTFIPYTVAMLTRAPGSYAAQNGAFQSFEWGQVERLLVTLATLPSPLHVYQTYLKPWNAYLFRQYWSPLVGALYFFIQVSIVAWTALFWVALSRVWRLRREAAREPIVLSALALLVSIPALLFFTRLGDFLHYWLGTMPFAYYLIAWAAENGPESPLKRLLSRGAWVGFALSLAVTALFIANVHLIGGLPGEYGQAYSAQPKP